MLNQPTEKQLNLCDRIGIEVSPRATKKEVGALISSRLAELKRARGVLAKEYIESGLRHGVVLISSDGKGEENLNRVLGVNTDKGKVILTSIEGKAAEVHTLYFYPDMQFVPSEKVGIPEGFYPLANLLLLAKIWQVTQTAKIPKGWNKASWHGKAYKIFKDLIKKHLEECSTSHGVMYKLNNMSEVVELWSEAVEKAETSYCLYCGTEQFRRRKHLACQKCWDKKPSTIKILRFCIRCGTRRTSVHSRMRKCSACQDQSSQAPV
ncbi:MAG: hypothetical protein HQ538_03060 [Parcubacteria group bacterium]|nr:hypothetical protein [Parcubacteria group bacterium]